MFPSVENVSTAFVSQYIRIMYPCILNSTGGVMITDMDMLPLNSQYYTKPIESFDNDKFIYYRGNLSISTYMIFAIFFFIYCFVFNVNLE